LAIGKKTASRDDLQDRKTARPQDRKTNIYIMYIDEILGYFLWPAFILVSWLILRIALTAYEKKFPGSESE
jgi:hypothetical protein